MTDRQQSHLIEIDSLFERLHETEAQNLVWSSRRIVILSLRSLQRRACPELVEGTCILQRRIDSRSLWNALDFAPRESGAFVFGTNATHFVLAFIFSADPLAIMEV